MEKALLESLRELGHETSPEVIRAGIGSDGYRAILLDLAREIHVLAETEERLSNGSDLNVLGIELASLLSELNCPYENLTSGSISDRFHNEAGSLRLLDYLATELMSLQMYHCNHKPAASNGQVIELQETPSAAALMGILSALAMGRPPAVVETKDLFNRLNVRIDELLKKVGRDRIGKPLLQASQSWSEKQWADLEKRHSELDTEYDLRREMLLTRLDCTVQAFNWSERMKHKQNDILTTYRNKLNQLERLVKGGASTDIVALLAARDLLLAIEKASSAAVLKNTKSKIQRHIMGSVKDRGGRTWEHAPPPPEMPSWQKQRATGGGGGGGGFQRGGGRGRGNHQGGGRGHQNYSQHTGQGGGSGRGHHSDQGGQGHAYDTNRGGGVRVQSGWSQRGRGRGGGGQHGQNSNRGGNYY